MPGQAGDDKLWANFWSQTQLDSSCTHNPNMVIQKREIFKTRSNYEIHMWEIIISEHQQRLYSGLINVCNNAIVSTRYVRCTDRLGEWPTDWGKKNGKRKPKHTKHTQRNFGNKILSTRLTYTGPRPPLEGEAGSEMIFPGWGWKLNLDIDHHLIVMKTKFSFWSSLQW